jgi:hypothetical protein
MSGDTPAAILARLAEDATPALLTTALEMFHACAFTDVLGAACGRAKAAHPQKDHRAWVPRYGALEAIRLIEMCTMLSRHEGKVDRELGLDKHTPPVVVAWLGITADEAKRLTPEELDRRMLEVMGGQVVDADARVDGVRRIEGPDGDGGAPGDDGGLPHP